MRQEIPVLARLRGDERTFVYAAGDIGGGRLALLPQPFGIVPTTLWLSPGRPRTLLWASEFPPAWSKLALVSTTSRRFWNAGHHLIELIKDQPNVYLKKSTAEDRLRECLDSRVLAARFAINYLDNYKVLVALRDRYPDEFRRFSELLNTATNPLFGWRYESIFAEDNFTTMIAGDEVGIFKRPYNELKELVLPDTTVLPIDNPEYLVQAPD